MLMHQTAAQSCCKTPPWRCAEHVQVERDRLNLDPAYLNSLGMTEVDAGCCTCTRGRGLKEGDKEGRASPETLHMFPCYHALVIGFL